MEKMPKRAAIPAAKRASLAIKWGYARSLLGVDKGREVI